MKKPLLDFQLTGNITSNWINCSCHGACGLIQRAGVQAYFLINSTKESKGPSAEQQNHQNWGPESLPTRHLCGALLWLCHRAGAYDDRWRVIWTQASRTESNKNRGQQGFAVESGFSRAIASSRATVAGATDWNSWKRQGGSARGEKHNGIKSKGWPITFNSQH